MPSLEATTRDIVKVWLDGFTWTVPPNVIIKAHAPIDAPAGATEENDCAPLLPTLDFSMPNTEEILFEQALAREDSPPGPIVFSMGRNEGDARFIFRCRSEAEAETFRSEWRRNAFQSMLEDGEHNLPVVKKLDGVFFGITDHIRIMLKPTTFLFQPTSADTALENLWILITEALISFPLFEVEPVATGRMNEISLVHHRCE